MSPAHTPFVRRANANGTTDTICTRCFTTVATAMWESDLDEAEQRHLCNPKLVEHWKDMAARKPEDGGDQKPPRPNRSKPSD